VDAVPALGAHTDAILTSIGYSSDSIDRLRSAGTL
jgi:crotonobetainyl-CoA:carnitine CoA-transferase CaiB-like acyl-CoA transferase